MPRRRMHLPGFVAQQDTRARLQHCVKPKSRAVLTRGRVAQGIGVPVAHVGCLAGRNRGAQRRPGALQGCVAAAVVAVQMGVEDAIQWPAREAAFQQGHGLLGMAAVAGVHHRRVALADKKDVVGRQPAALQHGDFRGEQVVGVRGAVGHGLGVVGTGGWQAGVQRCGPDVGANQRNPRPCTGGFSKTRKRGRLCACLAAVDAVPTRVRWPGGRAGCDGRFFVSGRVDVVRVRTSHLPPE